MLTKDQIKKAPSILAFREKHVIAGSTNDIWDLIRESENEDRLRRHRYFEMGDDALIWKMPQFDLDERGIDDLQPVTLDPHGPAPVKA